LLRPDCIRARNDSGRDSRLRGNDKKSTKKAACLRRQAERPLLGINLLL